MIDLTTVQTFPVLPSLAELEEQILLLIAKNKNLKGWLIGSGIALGIGFVFVVINENKNNSKVKKQGI